MKLPKCKSLFTQPGWKVDAVHDCATFLRSLVDMLPLGSVLYIESGGAPPPDVETYLQTRSIQDARKFSDGTIFPTPNVYRIPATRENLDGFASIEEKYPTPKGSVHMHVYRDQTFLLISYDAFMDPFWLSNEIPEDKVKQFCSRLGVTYQLTAPSLRR